METGIGSRVRTDGKQFSLDGARFRFRGVTYGTFVPRSDGALFPEREQVKDDFAGMGDAGFTVVRTYTSPTDDVLDAAAAADLRVLAGIFHPDWRYLVGQSRRAHGRLADEMRATVRREAARRAGDERVLALSLGNEVPADVVRWLGTDAVASTLASMVEVVREEDPDALVTYGNYPTTEYLPLDALDFLTFNLFLERPADFRRYLTRLHHLAGDRPVVLGELGLHVGDGAGAVQRQADLIDWQLEAALERGVAGTCVFSWTDEWAVGGVPVDDWRFGLTDRDRVPRPSLDVVHRWNAMDVADLRDDWPSISVVICAYNAASTIDECLRHTCALDYPALDIVVVDDGSTDETAAIAEGHPRVRVVRIPHAGLGVARNAGYAAATGELVAYLDSDAYPGPEWPYYLALGLDSPTLGGVGGPNVPPLDDPPGAHRVARAPGGPVHVLVSDNRAEHIPGCNMAFRKEVLAEVGGFDPVYQSAGDDVDLCWKVLDRGWEIGFHPAALVWHHRRPGTRAYLRQQLGYGRSEALVEARHPDRFTPIGTARRHGRIYDSFAPSIRLQRVYRGLYGTAAFQSVYRDGGHGLDLAHQIGVPLSVPALASAPLALIHPLLGAPALLALTLLTALVAIDVRRATVPHHLDVPAVRFRLGVAALHLLQPAVRTWGRLRHGPVARRDIPNDVDIAGPATVAPGGVLVLPSTGPRGDLVAALIATLRRAGMRVVAPSGWEDHDALVAGSSFVHAELLTSAHPEGCVQVMARSRPRRARLVGAAAAVLAAALVDPAVGAVVAVAVGLELWRGTRRPRQVLAAVRAAADGPAPSPTGTSATSAA